MWALFILVQLTNRYSFYFVQLVSWILMLASFPFAFLVLRTVKETNLEHEEVIYVNDVEKSQSGDEKEERKRSGEYAGTTVQVKVRS